MSAQNVSEGNPHIKGGRHGGVGGILQLRSASDEEPSQSGHHRVPHRSPAVVSAGFHSCTESEILAALDKNKQTTTKTHTKKQLIGCLAIWYLKSQLWTLSGIISCQTQSHGTHNQRPLGSQESMAWITYYSKTTKRRSFKDCTSNLFSQLMQTAVMIICTMMEANWTDQPKIIPMHGVQLKYVHMRKQPKYHSDAKEWNCA